MFYPAKHILVLFGAISLAPILAAQARPRGIYAVVSIEGEIAALDPMHTLTQAQLDQGFRGFYHDLLMNPAVAGLALQVHWDTVNPHPPDTAHDYFWNYIDGAFNETAAWNKLNPADTPKTIQLIVMPGFQSPQWLLKDRIPSCNGLFETPIIEPPSDCGTVTFTGFSEPTDSDTFPLPWNPVYKAAWQAFLVALGKQYGANKLLVSLAVAGPTAASAEMIVPNNGNSDNPQKFGRTLISPGQMWTELLSFRYGDQTEYLNTDQAFIEEWERAIDFYGKTFQGITLLVTTGNGFPNFPGAKVAIPPALAADCGHNMNLDCAAEATILEYFMEPSVGGNNAKASQTSGMVASHQYNNMNDMGVPGVKQLSYLTEDFTSPSSQVLGGSQFSAKFSNATLKEGCADTFPPKTDAPPPACSGTQLAALKECYKSNLGNSCIPVACIPLSCLAPGVTEGDIATAMTYGNVPAKDLISPEQAEYNVLKFFFDATQAAPAYSEVPGSMPAPMNYLQVYSEDIQYAESNTKPAPVVTGSDTVKVTAQDLLNDASASLFTIGEPVPSIASVEVNDEQCRPGEKLVNCEWIAIQGESLASGSAESKPNQSKSLSGISVTVDGKVAYLLSVSPTLVKVQIPSNPPAGSVPVVLTAQYGSATSKVTFVQ